MKKDRYHAYLRSSKWRYKRREAIRRQGRRCRKCGSKIILQAHHKSYSRLFKEKRRDLIVLCRRCHKEKHERSN